MPVSCVVLDFDGTFTDADAEAVGFERAFPTLLEDVVGRPLGGLWAQAQAEVLRGAPEEGWMFAGVASAPADADPYIRASCTAQRVLDQLGLLQDKSLRSDVITAVYRNAYRFSSTVMRPEAKPVVEQLLARKLPVYVVTNANAEVARAKLGTLNLDGFEKLHVVGDARKFLVCPPSSTDVAFEALPAVQVVEGLRRGVQLKRGAYLETLCRAWVDTGVARENTLVCGDIFELDLALPAALGCQVHLLQRPTTHAYERRAMQDLGTRGGFSANMKGLLERL